MISLQLLLKSTCELHCQRNKSNEKSTGKIAYHVYKGESNQCEFCLLHGFIQLLITEQSLKDFLIILSELTDKNVIAN